MNINYENNNIAHLRGEVVEEPIYSHEILGEGFYDLKISVPRLSEQFDIIPVTISERLLGDTMIGDTLSIDGQFRSYNKLEDGKSKLILTLFAKELVEDDSSINSNTITLTGYICKPPIYRTTPFGREICDCLLAVNRAYNKSDYIPCIAWGRNARFVKNLEVGSKVTIVGRIQSREYQKNIQKTKLKLKLLMKFQYLPLVSQAQKMTIQFKQKTSKNLPMMGDFFNIYLNLHNFANIIKIWKKLI